MVLRVTTAVAIVLGAGCALGELGEPQRSDVRQDLLSCQEFMCGTNSPQIAQFGFWELNLPPALGTPGLPNNVGFQVIGFQHGTELYLPRVFAGRLSATRTQSDGTVITLGGSGLVGGWLVLRNGPSTFAITVDEVGSVESWAQPLTRGPRVLLESYKLDWADLTGGGWREGGNVCTHPPSREDPDLLGIANDYAFHTLLFEGDRIDAARKLDNEVDNAWFNLGCAGHALAKMALTGHTEASRNAGAFDTTLSERQTMLKLLVADYCGDGTPFTVAGQPLNWRDALGTMKLAALFASPPQPLVLEARWTDQGAACLDKPRVDAHWTVLGNHVFGPDVYQRVEHHCAAKMPPSCADSSFNTAGYHLLSATVPYHP